MKVDPRAFVGKTVFVGIDVHKATYSFVAVCDGQIAWKVGSMPGRPEKLIEMLTKRFPEAVLKTAYEAGFSGFVLHRKLTEAGIENLVVHAAGIEVAANDRVKTDRRDAMKLAELLAIGRLKGIRVPTLEQELRRQLTRTRAQLVKERARIGIQIKAKLFQFGFFEPDDDQVMSAKLLKAIEAMALPGELGTAVAALTAVWRQLTEQVRSLDKQIVAQALSEPKLDAIYRSAPGIGVTNARVLANELGDMSQFRNERQLSAFLGLTPSEDSSGPHERKGHITRQGPGALRALLVEAAWMGIRKDPELAKIYAELKQRRGGKRAIVGVARRLANRLRACLRDGTLYEVDRKQKAA